MTHVSREREETSLAAGYLFAWCLDESTYQETSFCMYIY